MGNLDAKNYAKREATPRNMIPPREVSGSVVVGYDEYTVASADEIAAADVIRTGIRIPKGARILGGRFVCPATGATGQFDAGILGGDTDGLIDGADPGAAAVNSELNGALVGQVVAADSDVILTCAELTADAGTKTIQIWVYYSLP